MTRRTFPVRNAPEENPGNTDKASRRNGEEEHSEVAAGPKASEGDTVRRGQAATLPDGTGEQERKALARP